MKASILIFFTTIFCFAKAQDKPFKIAETQFVRDFISTHSETKRVRYCIPNTETCRDLVFMKNTSSFFNYFTSKERGVCAVEYFIKNENGTFRSYLDETCQSKPIVNYADSENINLRVSFDELGFPTVRHAMLRKHGTTSYAIADLIFSKEKNILEGTQFDSSTGKHEAIKIVYLPR